MCVSSSSMELLRQRTWCICAEKSLRLTAGCCLMSPSNWPLLQNTPWKHHPANYWHCINNFLDITHPANYWHCINNFLDITLSNSLRPISAATLQQRRNFPDWPPGFGSQLSSFLIRNLCLHALVEIMSWKLHVFAGREVWLVELAILTHTLRKSFDETCKMQAMLETNSD